jgi:chromosome segregation ATPase
MGTAMTPITAPELSALVGLSHDELVAQLESVAISNEMLRQSSRETETRLAEVDRHTCLQEQKYAAAASELEQARAALQSLQETVTGTATEQAKMAAALHAAEGSVHQLTVRAGLGVL